mmetsp:Transcript_8248/g.17126  ORF Transcript_8248/g.17126 Transcript_8248/m.17126 type:complete len:279 (+) Transcript_8248:264-1100(+)
MPSRLRSKRFRDFPAAGTPSDSSMPCAPAPIRRALCMLLEPGSVLAKWPCGDARRWPGPHASTSSVGRARPRLAAAASSRRRCSSRSEASPRGVGASARAAARWKHSSAWRSWSSLAPGCALARDVSAPASAPVTAAGCSARRGTSATGCSARRGASSWQCDASARAGTAEELRAGRGLARRAAAASQPSRSIRRRAESSASCCRTASDASRRSGSSRWMASTRASNFASRACAVRSRRSWILFSSSSRANCSSRWRSAYSLCRLAASYSRLDVVGAC